MHECESQEPESFFEYLVSTPEKRQELVAIVILTVGTAVGGVVCLVDIYGGPNYLSTLAMGIDLLFALVAYEVDPTHSRLYAFLAVGYAVLGGLGLGLHLAI